MIAAAGLLLVGGAGASGFSLLSGSDSDKASSGASASGAPSAAVSATGPSPSPSPSGPLMGGWYAGASGLGVADGAFQKWLDQPVTIAGTWADREATIQEQLTPLRDEYKDWTGAIDIALGGTVLGSSENYKDAARGAYDKRWIKAARNLAALRGETDAPTFVRVFHEMNGFWFKNWNITEANAADYRAAHTRYTRILRTAMPSVYISWSPNFRDHSGVPIEKWYPGDDVVDCVAPDYYDDDTNPGRLSVKAWNSEADDVDAIGNPKGPEAWRLFALKHGKPLCFPETGLKPSGGETDHPQWIIAFNRWLNAHANTATWQAGEPIPEAAAGTVLYSIYFNVPAGELDGFTIHGRGANPESEKVFRELTWGRPAAGP